MKKIFNSSSKVPWFLLSTVGLAIVFFSIRLIITYDSAHYLNYVNIFEGNLPASSWDIVRGPIFPLLIFLFDFIFGKTSAGILIGTFLFYLIFMIVCYKICKEICQNYKHKIAIQNILLAILIFNPLIMGYFHVLLTEFVAITFTMLNILIAYKWIFCNTHNKKHLFVYSLYFIFSIVFCYHLKQPYIIISFAPPLVAGIISISKKHSPKNILYRTGTLIMSLVILLLSIISWNKILTNIGANMDTGRDSSSLLSQQLLEAYQITYDQDGDGKTDPVSTVKAINIIIGEFTKNPGRLIGVYISNYCGLSSICLIETANGVNYTPTLNFAGIDTYENTAIGYRPYSGSSNIFMMPEHLYSNASAYGESSGRSLIASFMYIFQTPTNLLLKLSIILCLPAFIFIIILKIKTKDHKYQPLFYLSILLLSTSIIHMTVSAGLGLIIDRYAIEIFIPSMLGLTASSTYFICLRQTHSHKHS